MYRSMNHLLAQECRAYIFKDGGINLYFNKELAAACECEFTIYALGTKSSISALHLDIFRAPFNIYPLLDVFSIRTLPINQGRSICHGDAIFHPLNYRENFEINVFPFLRQFNLYDRLILDGASYEICIGTGKNLRKKWEEFQRKNNIQRRWHINSLDEKKSQLNIEDYMCCNSSNEFESIQKLKSSNWIMRCTKMHQAITSNLSSSTRDKL